MQVEATKKLFNVGDYYRMAEAGILRPEDRIELVDGEIIQMSPIGARHAGCVKWASNTFVPAFKGKAIVSTQDPIRLNNYTELEPDIALLKPRNDFYRGKQVMAEDAILIIEVADTTLEYDRKVKVPRYATAGIPEVWIEDLQGDQLLVFRGPVGDAFKTILVLSRGDSISVQAFPDVSFTVDELLG